MAAIAELIATDKIAAAAAAGWAETIIAGAPVAVRVCGRCKGKGSIPHYNFREMGICFECRGTAVAPAYTKAQRAAMRQRDVLIGTFWTLLDERVDRKERTTCTFPSGDVETCYAHDLISRAFQHLKENAPERFERLLASLEVGRIDAIIARLRTYADEAGVVV